MKRLLSCAESQDLDASARKLFGLDSLLLMEKASLRLWDRLSTFIEGSRRCSAQGRNLRILAICGKGDNGGDALAMLRHARSAGFENLGAVISSQPQSQSAQAQRGFLKTAGISCLGWDDLGLEEKTRLFNEADIVLDGILGSGVKGVAQGEALEMIEFVLEAEASSTRALDGELKPLIASVDIPSGLGDFWTEDMPAVKADICLCLEPVKEVCLSPSARKLCGRMLGVEDIFPSDLIACAGKGFRLEDKDLEELLEPVFPESYKMSRGRVAVFAGSLGSAGAALLCAKAAIAAGAGYVYLYVDEDLYPLLASKGESFILRPWNAGTEIPDCDVVLAGPGWGVTDDRISLLKTLGSLAAERPLILDADAIRLIARQPGLCSSISAPCVLTPHPGELRALLKAFGIPEGASFSQSIAELSANLGMLVLAKSHITWIQGENSRFVWEGMTPELGVAGSGDVLAGLYAGLLARRMARFKRPGGGAEEKLARRAVQGAAQAAACAAVIAHGGAGRRLAERCGWFDASALVEECAIYLHETDGRKGCPR